MERRGARKGQSAIWGIKAKITLLVEVILVISLMISYIIFIQDKIMNSQQNIKSTLKDTAVGVASNIVIQEQLAQEQNIDYIQEYAVILTSEYDDVDLIVIADQTGKKYAHPDEEQIGQIFIGEDKAGVLADGTSYYTTKEGSMGTTLRYFTPIMYEGRQVGFVMVGKYTDIIGEMYARIWERYVVVFVVILVITFFAVNAFARYMKKAMLDMEPEEIAALYLQKDTIINNVQDGVILVDSKLNVYDISQRAENILEGRAPEQLVAKLDHSLEHREVHRMQEIVVDGKRMVASSIPLQRGEQYFGTVITIMDWDEVNQIAKEMTGIEQKNKNLRATIHEFKNNLHIILGLLQLKEYSEAESYILKIQDMQTTSEKEFHAIQDSYICAMLMSKMAIAKERQVKLELRQNSTLMEQHGYVAEVDLTTIVGNLIENALEACSISDCGEKRVAVYFDETEKYIDIEVWDNGVSIDPGIWNSMWEMGASTKGEDRGIGLYLVKRKADIYRGKLQITEERDGKTFRVRLLKGEEYE